MPRHGEVSKDLLHAMEKQVLQNASAPQNSSKEALDGKSVQPAPKAKKQGKHNKKH
jgi:hypothetical protein